MQRTFIKNNLVQLLAMLIAMVTLGEQIPSARAEATLEDTNPAQWRLIWKTDPTTTATLCWNTAAAGNQHRVYLRESGQDEKVVVGAHRNGRYSAESPTLYFHHVELTDLKPATKYYVVMESDERRSPEMYFITAPAEDVPISILFGADSRSGHEERRQMNLMLGRMLAESQTADRTPILAFAHGGDYMYDGRQLNLWSQWMTDHELTVSADGQLLPIIPARGNHDGGPLFNEVFAFPPGDANYYGTDLGPQLRLLTLNTETSIAGNQRNWLEADLAAARPKKRWLIAQYHRPAFPAVKIPCTNLIHWVPLFERFNLDLACEGDGHNIKRTDPIRDFKIDPTGVIYIGEGGLGVGQRTPKPHRWYLSSNGARSGVGHHVQLLTFDKDQFSYRVVLLGGEVFDEHIQSVRPAPPAPAVATQ